MNQVKVTEPAYKGAGWAWSLRIGGGEVIHAHFIDTADGRPPTIEEVEASLKAFKADPIVVAAEAKATTAWEAVEAAEAANDQSGAERAQAAFDACRARVQLGMMSGGSFWVDFTKREKTRIGLDKLIYV